MFTPSYVRITLNQRGDVYKSVVLPPGLPLGSITFILIVDPVEPLDCRYQLVLIDMKSPNELVFVPVKRNHIEIENTEVVNG